MALSGDDERLIREQVNFAVRAHKSLAHTEKIVEAALDSVPISCLHKRYLTHYYFDACMQSIKSHVQSQFSVENTDDGSDSDEDIESLVNGIRSAQRLEDLPKSIKTLKKYQLLVTNKDVLHDDAQQNILASLQQFVGGIAPIEETFTPQVVPASAEDFSGYLKDLKNLYLHPKSAFLIPSMTFWQEKNATSPSWQMYKENFCELATELEREFDQLYDILNDTILQPGLSEELISSRQELIMELTLPLQTEVKMVTNKTTLVATKPVLLLSECLEEIENLIGSNEVIEEVHLIADEVIYINVDLKNETWHGKNILMASKRVECLCPNLEWNLSGVDGVNAPSEPAPDATSDTENGSPGADGTPGESGGNCMFVTDNPVNMNRLTVKSSGGAGGTGQPGGNGHVGKDGDSAAEISLSTLKSEFPSPVKIFDNPSNSNLTQIVDNIHRRLDSRQPIVEQTGPNWYISGETIDRMKIEFGYYAQGVVGQTYCLIKGATSVRGNLGTRGGKGGASAEGGFPGILKGYNWLGVESSWNDNPPRHIARPGQPGENVFNDGKNGGCGETKKNGSDVGFIDKSNWRNPVYYGPGSYELGGVKNKNKVDGETVFCPQLKYERCFTNVSRTNVQVEEHEKKEEITVKVRVNATHQNPISITQVLEIYKSQHNLGNIQAEVNTVNVIQPYWPPKNNFVEEEIFEPSFDMVPESNELTPDGISRERFKAFEAINEEGIINQAMSRVTTQKRYVSQPTSGGLGKSNDSPFHAIFGTKNSHGVYEAGKGKRGDVCQTLKGLIGEFQNNPVAQKYLKESLINYFQDTSDRSNDSSGSINGYHNRTKMERLDNLASDYNDATFDKPFDDVTWENQVYKSTEVISEYIDFLSTDKIPWLRSDLKLLATAFKTNLKIYKGYEHNGLDNMSSYLDEETESGENSEQFENTWRVSIDSNYQYSHVTQKLIRDRSELNNKITSIVSHAYNLHSVESLQQFFSNRDYLNTQILSLDELRGESHIHMVKAMCAGETSEKRSVLEARFLSWPPQLLTVFYEKILIHGGDKSLIRAASSKLTELVNNNPKDKCEDIRPSLIWTVATCLPEQWGAELLLTSVQLYFHSVEYSDIQSWREKLKNLPIKLIVAIAKVVSPNTKCFFGSKEKSEFGKFLETILDQNVNSDMDYSKLSKVVRHQWVSQLRKRYHESRLTKLPNVDWNATSNKQSQALYYLYSLYNEKGALVDDLIEALSDVLMSSGVTNVTSIRVILLSFNSGKYDLTPDNITLLKTIGNVDRWKNSMDSNAGQSRQRSMRDYKQILEIIEADGNNSLLDGDLQKLNGFMASIKSAQPPENFQQQFDDQMAKWRQEFSEKFKSLETSTQRAEGELILAVEALTRMNFVIKQKFGFELKDTQNVSILTALLLGCQDKNLLSQIATGEGKTLIVLAVAIIRGLFGERTDIVTSSSVLARRDANDYQHIYAAFGLTVGDVTLANEEKRIIAYTSTVVVGDIASYQRDFLLDRFYNKNIRGKRPYQNIIVDEVDSMFLDKAMSVLYLSHQPPGLDALEHLFVLVWKTVVDAVNTGEMVSVEKIRENILNLIYPSITQKDLENCVPRGVDDLRQWLIDTKMIDDKGHVVVSSGKKVAKKLRAIEFPVAFAPRKKQIMHLFQSKVEQIEDVVPVPNHLKKRFVKEHLSKWIQSAFVSTQLEEGKEYVVDVDHENVTLDKYSKITILDQATGEDLKNSQWNEALHQYFQMQHGCRLSPVSLKAVFTSNISFFKKYSRIFGLTGTMGTEADRDFLQSSYNVEFLSMPLALPKRFVEHDPIVCKDEAEWCDNIYKDVMNKITVDKRSVLIICGSVNEAEIIYGYFDKQRSRLSIHLYRRDYERFSVADNNHCLAPEKVIIATNLAGRGTDIKLSPELKDAGGLHAVFTYLSDNLRGEQQGLGRAGRKGDPGSGILIFIDKLSSGSVHKVAGDAVDLKILRDDLETLRVADIQTYHNAVIAPEENMFEKFNEKFTNVRAALDIAYDSIFDWSQMENMSMNNLLEGHIEDMKELVLDSMINRWAYFLDRYSTFLTNNYETTQLPGNELSPENYWNEKFYKMIQPYENLIKLKNSTNILQKATFSPMEQAILKLVSETDPVSTVKMAKCLMRRGELNWTSALSKGTYYREAETYLNQVIRNEPQHCIPALYYKLYCRIKLRENWPNLHKLCNKLLIKIDSFTHRQSVLVAMVNQVRESLNQTVSREGAYDLQKQTMLQVMQLFKSSVEDAVGKEMMTPHDFASVCGNPQVAQHAITHLVKEQALCGNFEVVTLSEDGDIVANLAKDFCMKKIDAENLLGKFSGKSAIHLSWQKRVKREANFPSRSDFFREISPCFVEGVEEFLVIQPKSEFERNLTNDFVPWLATKDPVNWISKRGCDISSPKQKVIKGKKLEYKFQQEFINLKQSGRLCYESVGHLDIDKLKGHQLTKHHKVNSSTFTIIDGINDNESEQIFDNLKSTEVIDNTGELITADWKKVKLDSELLVYKPDVVSILHAKCRYKFEVLSLLRQMETPNDRQSESYKGLKISLPSAPFKEFFKSAIQTKLVKGIRPNLDHLLHTDSLKKPKEGIKFAQEVYTECSPTWDEVTNNPGSIVTKIYDKIKKDGETEVKVFVTKDDLRLLFPHMDEPELNNLWGELTARGWITVEGEVKSDSDVHRAEDLSDQFVHYQAPLNTFRAWLLYTKNKGFGDDLVKICKNHAGKFKTLETPDAALESLRLAVSRTPWGAKNFGDELYLFELNGFNDIFNSMEQWYSWKMIGNATLVLLIGLAQIGIGVVIQLYTSGAGTFVGRGFIQEGINDVVTSLMAFGSGYFSWQDWVDNKWVSVAITAATMFIGGVNAKDVEHSKFGQKLFGNVKMSGAEIVKVGQTKEGMNLATKAVLRSCGHHVLKGVTIAGSTMATKFLYEATMKQISDKVFGDMYAQIDKTLQQHQILQIAAQLVNTFGVDDAEQKLEQSLFRVERNSTRDREAVRFLSVVGNIVQNGFSAATEKKRLTGVSTVTESTTVISSILSVVNTGTMVQKAMADLDKTVATNLTQLEKQLESEIRIQNLQRDESTVDPIVSERERQEFLAKFQDKVGNHLKKKLGDVVQYEIFQPIMYQVVHTLAVKAGRTIKDKYRAKNELETLNKSNQIIKDGTKGVNSANSESGADLSNNLELRKLSLESRDPAVVGHIVENGGPIGMEGLVAAANESNHTICVTSDDPNMCMVLNPIGNGDFSPSAKVLQIHYNSKEKTFESESSRKSSENSSQPSTSASTSQSTPETGKLCPLEAINIELKQVSPATQSIARKQIALRIQKDPYVQHFVKKGWHHSYAQIGTSFSTNSTLGQPLQGQEKDLIKTAIKNDKKEYINTLTFPAELKPVKNLNENGTVTNENSPAKSWFQTFYSKHEDKIKSIIHEGDISFGMISDKTLSHHNVVDGLQPALGRHQEHAELMKTNHSMDPELYQRIDNIAGNYISVHCAQCPSVKFIVRSNLQRKCEKNTEKASHDVILSYTLNGIPDPNRPEEVYHAVCFDNKPPKDPPRKCFLSQENL